MKMGVRKPSIKKSVKARTTGRMKRSLKKSVNPLYGKKGVGLIRNPKKSIYNKVYSKTTVGVGDLIKGSQNSPSKASNASEPLPRFSLKTLIAVLGLIISLPFCIVSVIDFVMTFSFIDILIFIVFFIPLFFSAKYFKHTRHDRMK